MRGVARVAVIGAGPAGSTAARNLALSGHDVTLVDRMAFPRDKACGDALTLVSQRLLSEAGLGAVGGAAHGLAGTRQRRNTRATWLAGTEASTDRAATVATLPRLRFDSLLIEAALAAGARFCEATSSGVIEGRDGVTVIVQGRDEDAVTGQVFDAVIACDGAWSPVARSCGLHPGRTEASAVSVRRYLQLETSQWDQVIDVFAPVLGPDDPNVGFGWVLPIGGRVANVGVYRCGTAGGRRARTILDRFVGDVLAPDHAGEIKAVSPTLAGVVRYDFSPDRVQKGRVLLAGDAAGLSAATSGEGISFALRSGALAALTVRAALDGAGSFSDHRGRMEEAFANEVRRERAWLAEGLVIGATQPLFPSKARPAHRDESTVRLGGSVPPDWPERSQWMVTYVANSGRHCDAALLDLNVQRYAFEDLGCGLQLMMRAPTSPIDAPVGWRTVESPHGLVVELGPSDSEGDRDAVIVTDPSGVVMAVYAAEGHALLAGDVLDDIETMITQ